MRLCSYIYFTHSTFCSLYLHLLGLDDHHGIVFYNPTNTILVIYGSYQLITKDYQSLQMHIVHIMHIVLYKPQPATDGVREGSRSPLKWRHSQEYKVIWTIIRAEDCLFIHNSKLWTYSRSHHCYHIWHVCAAGCKMCMRTSLLFPTFLFLSSYAQNYNFRDDVYEKCPLFTLHVQ